MFHRRILVGALAALAVAVTAATASAEVKTKTIEYAEGGVTLRGFLSWDDAKSGARPGVLVVHEWWGLNDYAKYRTRRLAEEGYVAFALDLYGDGKVTTHAKEAGAWTKQITQNIDGWVTRAVAGLKVLKSQKNVDTSKIAVVGYCFGGSTVMQMAYAGVDVNAVVSFHGSLPPASDSVTSIKPRVLVAHGRDDAFVPKERVLQFQDGLDRIKAKWEMTIYSGTRHSFTNPDAASVGLENVVYNETADKRSWAAMQKLFGEVF